MDTNQILALILLLGRIPTVFFVGATMRLQWKLIKQNTYPEDQWFRKLLFGLTTVLMLGNILPIWIDVEGLFHKGGFVLLVAYVFSNNITALLSGGITWYIYHLSSKKIIITNGKKK